MPALIKTNAAMASGQQQLTTYNINTDADASLIITAEFVALSQFASEAFASFKIGSPLHIALQNKSDVIAALQTYEPENLPTLSSCDITTSGGLCTMRAAYTGIATITAGADESNEPIVDSEVTSSMDLRSIGGSYTEDGVTYNWSADYYATTVTGINTRVSGKQPSELLNKRGRVPALQKFTQRTSQSYRNNLGQFKYQVSVTIIYIT